MIDINKINISSIIKLNAGKLFELEINKNNNKIIIHLGNGNIEEINKNILYNEEIREGTIGYIILKIFQGNVDEKCIKILNTFNEIICD